MCATCAYIHALRVATNACLEDYFLGGWDEVGTRFVSAEAGGRTMSDVWGTTLIVLISFFCFDDDWLFVMVSDLYCVQCINRRPTYKLDWFGCSLTLLLGPNQEHDA